MEDTPATKRRRGARPSKAPDAMSPTERKLLQKVLDRVYEYLLDLEEPTSDIDENGEVLSRGLIDPFLELVPKTAWPQYYVQIKSPICMEQIKNRINNHEYQTLREFRDDVHLLCNNARAFNEDGSQLFLDANTIDVSLSSPSIHNQDLKY